jgi:hypothetical protein
MKAKQKPGRPGMSGNARVIPEFRESPDVEKLGRALLAVAKSIAEKKRSEDGALNINCDSRKDGQELRLPSAEGTEDAVA